MFIFYILEGEAGGSHACDAKSFIECVPLIVGLHIIAQPETQQTRVKLSQSDYSARVDVCRLAWGFELDKEPGVHVGRFPLTCGGFIFPHIHIGLILCISHASENPGSRALSGPLLSLGNLRCHCTQKEPWKPSNSSRGYYLQYQKKTALPLNSSPPSEHRPSVSS